MGRRAEVTPDQIIAAGEQLLAEGKNVNGFAIRKMLKKGGPDYLERIWIEAQKAAEVPAIDEARATSPLPPALAERRDTLTAQISAFLDGIVAETWHVADDIARRRTADDQDAARETIAAAELRLADARTAIDETDAAKEAVEADRDRIADTLRDAEAEGQRLVGRLTAAEEAARGTAATIADLTARLSAAEKETAAAHQTAAAAIATAQAAGTEADRLRSELAAGRVEAQATADRARQDIDAVRADAQAATDRAHAERDALRSEMQAVADRARADLDAARSEAWSAAERARADLDALRSGMQAAAERSHADLDAARSEAQSAADRARADLDAARNTNAALTAQLAAANARVDTVTTQAERDAEARSRLENTLAELTKELTVVTGRAATAEATLAAAKKAAPQETG